MSKNNLIYLISIKYKRISNDDEYKDEISRDISLKIIEGYKKTGLFKEAETN